MNLEIWDLRLLRLAKHISEWSKDISTKCGSVIADDKCRVISVGFNGFPKGVKDDDRLLDRETKYKIVIHAEENALLFAPRLVEGCWLYIYPFMPCAPCASKIVQSGINRVIYPIDDELNKTERWERWKGSFDLSGQILAEAHVEMKGLYLGGESLK